MGSDTNNNASIAIYGININVITQIGNDTNIDSDTSHSINVGAATHVGHDASFVVIPVLAPVFCVIPILALISVLVMVPILAEIQHWYQY